MAVMTMVERAQLENMCPVAKALSLDQRLKYLDSDGSFNGPLQLDTVDVDTIVSVETAKFGTAAGSTGVALDGTDPDQVLQAHGYISSAVAAGAYAGTYTSLTAVATQTNNVSLFGMWAELYLTGNISLPQNNAAIWGNLEMADATGSLTLAGGIAWHAAIIGTVIAPDGLVVSSGGQLAGLMARSHLTAGYTATGAYIAGVAVNKGSSNAAWPYGIYIESSATEEAISIGTSVTAITIGATTTAAILISGTATAAQISITGSWGSGLTNGAILIGNYSVAKALGAISEHYIGQCIHLSAAIDDDSNVIGLHSKFTTTGACASAVVQPVYGRVDVAHNIADGYGLRGHVAIGGSDPNVSQLFSVFASMTTTACQIQTAGTIALFGGTISGTADIDRAGSTATLCGMYINWDEQNAMTVPTYGVMLNVRENGRMDYGFAVHGGYVTSCFYAGGSTAHTNVLEVATAHTNLMALPAAGTAPCGSQTTSDYTFTKTVKIKILIGSTIYYLIADTT